MKRRALLAAPLAVAGCGLDTRPYAELRQWPLRVRRPQALPPRRDGPVLLVRGFVAGPGMEARGLQSVQADGSIRTEFYEEWSAPPAEAMAEAVRSWLSESGLFSAVLAPGSRLAAGFVLEAELDALWTVPAERRARTALGVTLVAEDAAGTTLLLQRRMEGTAELSGPAPGDAVNAMMVATSLLCGEIERRVGNNFETAG